MHRCSGCTEHSRSARPLGGQVSLFRSLRWGGRASCGIQDLSFSGLRCSMTPSRDISRLLEIMAMLRTPGTGCPWDLEQNFSTIPPYTIEEAYEVADAIARGHLHAFQDDLRDLLFHSPFPPHTAA